MRIAVYHTSSSLLATNDSLSSIMPSQKSTAMKMPKDGWVHELGDAESAAKRSRSAGAQLRLAIAAYKLRDFKKVKTAANLGLALDPNEGEKELLNEYVEKSKEQKEMTNDCNILLQDLRHHGAHCDHFNITAANSVSLFTNLNILHYAVMTGNVTMMEEVVALGAALDFPVWDKDKNAPDIPPLPAPPGSTALLLACSILAIPAELIRLDSLVLDRICECAIQLVHLGADCQVKLQIPAQRRNAPVNPHNLNPTFRALNFDGKTAQELASISCRRELIRAIELMQNSENVHLTQCRCGSRLPWNQCHGAPVPGQSDLYVEDGDGRLHWRYSPKARCPCNLMDKEHYECCWFTSTPCYKNDATGRMAKLVKHPFALYNNDASRRQRQALVEGPTTQAILRLQRMRMSEIMDPNERIVRHEYRTTQTDLIRSEGLAMLSDFNGRRCGVKDWDPMVYAGVMDRIDNCFAWNDLHWPLTKGELLQRTKEWNEALKEHCDGIGLTGAEREAVVQRHSANPCAPCSNPSCNNWETEPKEFKTCSRCKAVAYCSRDCQKKDWKALHKSTCVPI
jgi:hypothetical protein